ncbi:MAG: DUF2764 family protein [Dehalococcoidia bacterium]
MAGDSYFLLTSLPTPGELGSSLPVYPPELLRRVAEAEGNTTLIEVLFLSDDLLQRQAFLAGEIQEAEPAALTEAQIRNEEALPEFLQSSAEERPGTFMQDSLWESYFRYAASVAESLGSEFLQKWVRYEVTLRNALATSRAKALNLDPQAYLVAPELGGEGDFSSLISEWSAAPDPLAGLRVLDQARWWWLDENDGWFTFSDDEVAAYAARLMLLKRWKRLSEETSEARAG